MLTEIIGKLVFHIVSLFFSEVAEDPFATLTRVDGLRGIYIASVVATRPKNGHIGLDNLATMISFDRGGEWRLLTPPQYDDEGNPIKCDLVSCLLYSVLSGAFPDGFEC